MNKLIPLSIFFIFLLSSCTTQQEDTKDDPKDIITCIRAAERIISRYNVNVQSAIDSKNFEYILSASKTALDSTSVNLENLENLELSPEYDNLKNAAANYISSLQEVVKAGEAYSTITESISERKAKIMDERILLSVKQAQIEYAKYQHILELLPEINN